MSSPLRRFAAVFAAALLTTMALAVPALAADGDGDPGPGPDPGEETRTRTLTVTPPSIGKITGTGIDCGVAADDCTRIVTYPCTVDACSAPSVTLTASGGPNGFSADWSESGCATGPTCSVLMDVHRSVSLSWVDTTGPSLVFNVTKSRGFVTASATDNSGNVARYEWTVNNVLQTTTGSTLGISSYPDGEVLSITVKAYDAANNGSTTWVSSVTLDKHAGLVFGAGPAYNGFVTTPPSLAFTLDPDIVSTQCRAVRQGEPAPAWANCTSPFAPSIADGSYLYEVKIVDDVGNMSGYGRPFTLDSTLPSLAFTDGPPEGSTVGSSTFTYAFSATDATALTIQCALDSGAYGPCTSTTSHTLSGVAAGSHVFRVRARDAAGNERVIMRNFAVSQLATNGTDGSSGSNGSNGASGPSGGSGVQAADTAPPLVQLAAKATQRLKSKALAVSVTSNEGGIASAKATYGKLSVGTLSKTVTAGKTSLKLKLSKKAQAALAKALKKKKTLSIKVVITVRDLAGNAKVVTKSVKVVR